MVARIFNMFSNIEVMEEINKLISKFWQNYASILQFYDMNEFFVCKFDL